ncbi:MAG: thioredoxin family protein [Verrucomicrobia bacterium]|nr:thioredoxin family protein [Verrucomicrobiota bacterium]
MKTKSPENSPVVSPEKWLAARRELLREEKELTKLADRLAQRRRELPRVRMTKPYTFDSPRGRVSLADLFEGRSQLIVQHFMFGPGWEEGCKSCSFMMDHVNPCIPHLQARDVSFAAISHAPLGEILPFKARMGWAVNWVSSHGTDFNFDFHVSFTDEEMASGSVAYNYTKLQFPSEEAPGISVFVRDAAGTLYHTYSTYGRGVELVMATYNLLDLVPKGRDEDGLEYGMEWVRYHDRYDQSADVAATH